MSRITEWAMRHAWWTIAAWLLVAVAMLPLAATLEGQLKAGGFQDPNGESATATSTLHRVYGEPENSLQLVVRTDHGSRADVQAAVEQVASLARATPHIEHVTTAADNPALASNDGRTSLVALGVDADNTTTQNMVEGLRDEIARSVSGPVEVDVTGAPALDYDLNVQSKADATRAEMIAFPLLFIVLLLIFRSVAAMLVPLTLAGMTLVITQGIGNLLARVTDLSILYTNGVSLIGLAVAVDYSLFIIKRYRDELHEAPPGETAGPSLRTAMSTAGHAVVFSGLAVVVALSTLLIPRLMVFTSIGLAGVAVTLVALGMSMTLLPAVLTVLGRRIDWGRLRSRSSAGRRPTTEPTDAPVSRWRAAAVLVLLVGAFVAMALPLTGMRLQVPVASASILPTSADSRQGVDALRDSLGTELLFPVQVVVSGQAAGQVRATADDLARWGQTLDDVTRAVVDDHEARDGSATVARVTLFTAADPDSDAAHELVRDVRDELTSVSGPGVSASVGGATAVGTDFDQAVVKAVPAILGAVTLATLLLLGSAFRSWRLPLLALGLNGLVVCASLGLLTLVSQQVLGEDVNSVTPILLFAIMFGLSMDYLVIMISRMREYFTAGLGHDLAIRRGLRQTAGLVNAAAVIMVAVFASFMSAQISIVRQLGLGLAVAVLLDAVIVRRYLMPAALQVLGPRVWGRQVTPTVSNEAGEQPRPVDLTAVSSLAESRWSR